MKKLKKAIPDLIYTAIFIAALIVHLDNVKQKKLLKIKNDKIQEILLKAYKSKIDPLRIYTVEALKMNQTINNCYRCKKEYYEE